MNNAKNVMYSHQMLTNKPYPCSFCGAMVQGRVQTKKDKKTQEIVKECHWICNRCGNVSKVGKIQ